MNWAFEVQGLPVLQKFLLVALADHADDDGRCWPSLGKLERKTCASRRGILLAFRALESAGLVSRARSSDGKTSTMYTLHMGGQLSTLGNSVARGRQLSAPLVGNSVAPNLHLEPSLNPKEVPTSSDEPAVVDKPKVEQEAPASKAIDPMKVAYDTALALLARYDIDSKQARGLIGRWRKSLGNGNMTHCKPEDLLAVFIEAGRAERAEIIPFVNAVVARRLGKSAAVPWHVKARMQREAAERQKGAAA